MMIRTKDPDATLDYGIDWAGDDPPWLPTGVTISTSTWTVPDGLTKVSDSKTTTTTTIVVKEGNAGENYVLTNHIVRSDGLEDDRSIMVQVRDR